MRFHRISVSCCLLFLLLPSPANAGFFDRAWSKFMHIFDGFRDCPFRMHKMELPEPFATCQVFCKNCVMAPCLKCHCDKGFILDIDQKNCIPIEDCREIEGPDHDFFVDQVRNSSRGYNITCDFESNGPYCDLTQFRRDNDKLVQVRWSTRLFEQCDVDQYYEKMLTDRLRAYELSLDVADNSSAEDTEEFEDMDNYQDSGLEPIEPSH